MEDFILNQTGKLFKLAGEGLLNKSEHAMIHMHINMESNRSWRKNFDNFYCKM